MDKFSVVYDLKDRNIGLEGEEFYAVLAAYVKKISSLAGLVAKDEKPLLRAAAKFEVTGSEEDKKALEKELKEFVEGQDKDTVKVCLSNLSELEKIETLNDIAVLLDVQSQIKEKKFRSSKYAEIDDKIIASSVSYSENKGYYKDLARMAYDDSALEKFIKEKAGSVAVPMEVLKTTVRQSLPEEENKFLGQQSKFIGKVVRLIVEDCRLVLMHKNNEVDAAAQAS